MLIDRVLIFRGKIYIDHAFLVYSLYSANCNIVKIALYSSFIDATALFMGKMNISGRRIRALRRNKNLKQVDLAAALNVDYGFEIQQSEISKIERNKRRVYDSELHAIAEILGVDMTDLIDREKL